MDSAKLRQYKLGELRWVATASRPDISARLARIAQRVNALCRSYVYRIHALVRAADAWRQAIVPKYASPSRPWRALGGSGKGRRIVVPRLWLGGRMLPMEASRRRESVDGATRSAWRRRL